MRVITLITGGIDTKFLANLETVPSLPEDSYYKVIEKDIMKQEEKVPFGVTPESFARDVLKRVESGRSGKYWVGGAAWLSRVTNWFAGEWVSVSVSVKRSCEWKGRLIVTGSSCVVAEAVYEEVG